LLQLLPKRLALHLILAIRPGLWDFEGKALPVEKSHHRFIAALNLVGFRKIPMKGLGRPERPFRFLRLCDETGQLRGLFTIEDRRSTGPFPDNQSIDTVFIEGLDPTA
jgi:hypothetical protein